MDAVAREYTMKRTMKIWQRIMWIYFGLVAVTMIAAQFTSY
jgi:hypothetical protein